MSIFVIGIDLGKNVCSLVGLDETGAVVMRRRLSTVSFTPSSPAGCHQRLDQRHNQEPDPFIWKADPDEIIAALKRGHRNRCSGPTLLAVA